MSTKEIVSATEKTKTTNIAVSAVLTTEVKLRFTAETRYVIF